MALKVLELHHHGIRVGGTEADADRALAFYRNVLGLSPDPGRPEIPTIRGYWMDVGSRAVKMSWPTGPAARAAARRRAGRPAHARAYRAARRRLRPRGAEPGRELARPLA